MPNGTGHTVINVHGRAGKWAPKRARTAEQARRDAAYEAMRDLADKDVLYAIRCSDGLIKIGHTKQLRQRRGHLSTNLEDILAVWPGTYEDEQALHDQLVPHRGRAREYYHPTTEVLDVVNQVRSRAGLATVA